MRFLTLFLGTLLSGGSLSSFAQDKSSVKFGKITPEDFVLPAGTDTSHGAVIIADIGEAYFEGNAKGWFSLLFKHMRRVKIVDKNGFDAAKGEISLYTNGSGKEKVYGLKGYTYNLDGGKVVETKLNDESIFADKINKNILEKKFTMPAVKEGSIIEYSYTTTSDFLFTLQPWTFQGEYPRLWSEYKVAIPQFFGYVFLTSGYLKFDVNERKDKFGSFSVIEDNGASRSDRYTFSGNVVENRWAIKNVPSLKEEKFTSTLRNHVEKIEFQLSEYRQPLTYRSVMGNWVTASESLMKDEDFGANLSKSNNWLDDDIKAICAGAISPKEKAEKIFAFVRDNFTCTDHSATSLTMPLKQVFSKKNGNVAEINLLLIAMMSHEGILAKPVLLSTRDHGVTNEIYPMLNLFNYVICQLTIGESTYFLDASRPYLGFNKLPADCYNGHARVIDPKLPAAIYFYPDSLVEKKMTSIFITTDEADPKKLNGSFQTQLGYYEAQSIRNDIRAKGVDAFFTKMKSAYGFEVDIKNAAVDSLKKKEQPISFSYNFLFDVPEDGMVYINPMMAEGIKDNYFKSAERFYPVEMPYAFDETYIFNFEIPKGYVVEEIPKSTKVSFNETDGFFEYMVDKDDATVRLKSRIKLNKATFPADEYESLREFFSYIVKKHAEQIVLKKKS
jgi:Domain of Unknown Function with PDB structure (DUF3858)/Transglutaminase-like superfamily